MSGMTKGWGWKPKKGCTDTCAPTCEAPCDTCAPTCAAPKKSCLSGLGGGSKCGNDTCAPTCEAPCAPTCTDSCTTYGSAPKGLFGGLFGSKKSGCSDTCTQEACEGECCDADPCEIAKLIYESQTACYAKDRRKAIDKLGDKYSCICNPEIMCAFVYALNDADEDVRKEAADEIGDQIKEHGQCCCQENVISALTAALGDCDRGVRKQAEEALEACGYEIVDGCCDGECGDNCNSCNTNYAPVNNYAPVDAAPVHPAAPGHAVPVAPGTPTPADLPNEGGIQKGAPVPADAPVGYRPRKSQKSRLANLFGLRS